MTPDFLYGVTTSDLIYDEECYPNIFTIGILDPVTARKWLFEISQWQNDVQKLCNFLDILAQQQCRMVGFNNIGYDYPLLHFIYQNRYVGIGPSDIYNKSSTIIKAHGPAKFSHMVWESDQIVPQIDLYKIHHFDNKAKMTGLKILEFNMRMHNIEDLPYPVGTTLTYEQAQELKSYMWHDIDATKLFHDRTRPLIEFREELSQEFDRNMINMNDVKIGETILVTEMEKAGIECYEYISNKKVKKQTKRHSIDLSQALLPYINFERQEFQNIKNFLQSQTITETNGVFKGLIANVEGIPYKFGTGGIHASVESQVIYTTETHQIVDVDVASFYPNLGIKNKLFPEHLGVKFCDAYEEVYHSRKEYPKGTPRNEALKLALNGAYGGSNNDYSPFLDPLYTMSITLNGQLLLCMLTEQMLKVPGLRMIQANTDGITYLCPREYLEHTRAICRWWEDFTRLELEEQLYSRMFIRDVNSYIAEKENGELKRIGAYAYITPEEVPGTRELPHHKDWSARVVAMAAEAALVHGEDVRKFVAGHKEIFDFFLRTKVPRSSTLEWGGEQVSNIARYYISTDGKPLEKVMPPAGPEGEYKRANKLTDAYFSSVIEEIGLGIWDERIHTKNKSVYEWRRSFINVGWNVMICNNLTNAEWVHSKYHPCDLNYEWYIQEAEKLIKPLIS